MIVRIKSLLQDRLKSANVKSIVANISWLFFDKILRMGVGLFVGVWVARYLGPASYGLWNYAIAIIAILSVLSTLGMDSLLISYFVARKYSLPYLLGTSLFLRIIGTLIMFFISVVYVTATDPDNNQLLLIIVITSFGYFFQSLDVLDYYYQSKVESKYVVIAKNSAFVLVAIYRVFLIVFKASLIHFVIASLFEYIIGAAFIYILFIRHENAMSIANWKVDKKLFSTLIKSGWPLMMSGLVVMIYMRIDQIMIGQYLTSKEVGVYSAAVKISELWYFVPMVLCSSVFPSIIAAKKRSALEFNKKFQRLFNLMVVLSLPLAVIVSFFSEDIILLVYGIEYLGAAESLMISIWASVFVFFGVASGNFLIVENLFKISLYKAVIGALINIGLNIFFIPRFGIAGAAFSTLISYSIQSYFSNFFFRKTRRLFLMQTRALFMLNLITYTNEFIFRKFKT